MLVEHRRSMFVVANSIDEVKKNLNECKNSNALMIIETSLSIIERILKKRILRKGSKDDKKMF